MKVLIYPKADGNPYHELLYGEMRKSYPESVFTYLVCTPLTVVFFPVVIMLKRLQGYRLFHLHWLAFYLDPKYGVPFSRQISLFNTIWSLVILKLLGYKLVWTVHDLLPHDTQTSNDLLVARILAKLANIKIVPATSTLVEMKRLSVDDRRSVVVPLGSYEGAYTVDTTKAQSRSILRIPSDSFVFTSFGRAEPYKGLDVLVEAFTHVSVALPDKRMTLVIAGGCKKPEIQKNLEALVAEFDARRLKNANIVLHLDYIDNSAVQIYHQSADIEVYPFTEITNSSSILLSFAFGKAIIAPRMGALCDLPQNVGLLYEPTTPERLAGAMKAALLSGGSSAFRRMSHNAAAYSASLSWHTIAERTYGIYDLLLRRVTPDESKLSRVNNIK